MEPREPTSRSRTQIGWMILAAVLLADAGLALWWWSGRLQRENVDASGLNLAEAPKPDALPAVPIQTPPSVVTSYSNPFASNAKPARSAAPPLRVAERPEWAEASASFLRLAQQPKYRQSPVLKNWAKDFMAYPDLRAIGRKYARDRDLSFFTVSVLRSTNFAKMLWKYGPSPDVKNFFTDLMAAPGVGASSRALFEDRNVMNSVKDLTIPGLPSLGQMMGNGGQGQTPQTNDAALLKFMQEQQHRSQQ